MRLADRVIIPLIVSVQFLFCLWGSASMLFLWRYGGAQGHSILFLLLLIYCGAGFGSTVYLTRGKRWSRVVSLGWNLCWVAYPPSRGANVAHTSDWPFPYIIAWGFFVIAYLGITAALEFVKGANSA
jgi:hypothetical protein